MYSKIRRFYSCPIVAERNQDQSKSTDKTDIKGPSHSRASADKSSGAKNPYCWVWVDECSIYKWFKWMIKQGFVHSSISCSAKFLQGEVDVKGRSQSWISSGSYLAHLAFHVCVVKSQQLDQICDEELPLWVDVHIIIHNYIDHAESLTIT